MAMRTPARKFEREEMVAYIHGIEPNGEVAHILVHKRGSNVRFSGRLGDHKVSPSKADDMANWVREAETVWGLDGVIGVHRGWTNTPETLQKMEALNMAAAKRREQLKSQPLEPSASELTGSL